MPFCFFHTDPDGMLSAAILKRSIPSLTLIPMGNGWRVPYWKIVKGDIIYVVDLTFSPEDMKRLNTEYSLVWIDHHGPVIKAVKDTGIVVQNGIQDDSVAACVLVWRYQHPDLPIPKMIEKTSLYDIGVIFDDPSHPERTDILSMNVAIDMEAEKYSVPKFVENPQHWIDTLSDDTIVDALMTKGRPFYEFQRNHERNMANYIPSEKMFHGHVALCANVAAVDPSDFFSEIADPTKHDLTITFYFNKRGVWVFSLRAVPGHPNPPNVAELAALHGGGGHPRAAGFKVMDCDFPLVLNPAVDALQ